MNARTEPAIVVREAIAEDAETIAALMAEMDDVPAAEADASAIRHVIAEMSAYPDHRVYLALDLAGTPVGTFSLMIFCSPSHQGARQGMLDGVVVTRAQRGQGVGRAMLRHALTMAASAGCYKLALSSNLKRVDAHRFYEDIGFQQHGISFSIPIASGR
jgi:GNAT superfamily N-acetyltransferase